MRDQTGRLIRELANISHYEAIVWETDALNRQLSAGIYFLQVRNGQHQIVKKLVQIR